jgi:drug efflux transport system ATP-binding protein
VNSAVSLQGVSKHFGTLCALDGLSCTLMKGQLIGLVGPDGAGKTTLMRILAALLSPSEGVAKVAGLDVADNAGAIHQLTGYMPQRFGLYEDLSVQENLNLHWALCSRPVSEQPETFDRLLEFTGLAPFTKRLAGRLSGGMKQKLGLACALMSRPQILLLDEPSVGVDPLSRQELWLMVQDLTHDGMTVIWSTAYLDEAERCDHVLLLDQGKLLFQGAPRQLTSPLEGRSFRVHDIQGERRDLLASALELPATRDGVIQGQAVRLLLDKPSSAAQLNPLLAQYQAKLQTCPPRFEDAFIDLLGGSPGGKSALAQRVTAVANQRGAMVECHQLGKHFGDFCAADNISFSVQRGEIFGLLGPNGAGKSTTFKMLCGLLKPTSGSAQVVGLDLRHSPGKAKIQLGYMAQKFSLYGLLSVRQNLEFFAGVYGLSGQQKRRRIDEMIDVFDLHTYLDTEPDSLPLGYKQRLALSCAVMHSPSVLFLDEPTSGVDPLTRREFWTHITGLVGRGVTVLVTTHFMDEAEYCDRVALINNAMLFALDTPDALKRSAATIEVPTPTMEQAFITLVREENARSKQAGAA